MNSLATQHLQWMRRHVSAVSHPSNIEKPFVHLMQFLQYFRISYAEQFGSESQIADDSYIGDEYLGILKATRALLSTELGNLDGGTLDAFILEQAKAAGFTEDNL